MLKTLRYLRPYWRSASLAPLLMALEVAMDLLQPLLMARIVDQGVLRGDFDQVLQTGQWMIACAVLGLLGGFGCTVLSSKAAIDAATDLRRDLFQRVQRLPLQRLESIGQGSLLTRLTADVAQVQQFSMMLLRVFVRSPLLALGSLSLAALIDWRLALLILLAMPLLGVALYWLSRRTALAFGQLQNRLDQLNEGLRDNLAGIRTVKAFAAGADEQQRFERLNQAHTRVATQAWRIVALNGPTLLLLNATLVAVLWFGTGRTQIGALGVGELAAFISYLGIALAALASLGNLLMQLARARIAAQRIGELLTADTADDVTAPLPEPPAPLRGEVACESLSFAYGPRAPVLNDLSFRIEAGQRIALLGWTGAGKSTLLALLAGLYPASSGQVKLDGQPLGQWPEDWLRRQVGLVSQQPLLFSASVRDNILLGRTVDEQALRAAARIAQADDFIRALPQGYDTQLDSQGGGLSGGQRQRLAIARALLARPALLLLDDCSSALDADTERRLFAALREALPDSTWLVATQRLEIVEAADGVLLLEQGRLVAQGSPAQLRASSPAYRAWLAAQPTETTA